MGMLEDFFDALVGKGQHNVILLVCAGDVEQYISNTSRERGVASLKGLLARWQAGVPDALPETPIGSTPELELLLDELVAAARGTAPGGPDVDDARRELRALFARRIPGVRA